MRRKRAVEIMIMMVYLASGNLVLGLKTLVLNHCMILMKILACTVIHMLVKTKVL